jgi:hypothetical protein
MNKRLPFVAACLAACLHCGAALGGVVSYSSNFEGWQQVAGPYTSLTFTEFPAFTVITDQYAGLGVTLTNPTRNVVKFDAFAFQQDGVGIDANGMCELTFDTPMKAAAAHFFGSVHLQLFLGEVYLGEVQPWNQPLANVVAAVSTTPFDRIRFKSLSPLGEFTGDNIYFSPIPSPGGVTVFVAFAGLGRRRRR